MEDKNRNKGQGQLIENNNKYDKYQSNYINNSYTIWFTHLSAQYSVLGCHIKF